MMVINGTQFTEREINIISCMLVGRTTKRIASLLAIAPKTVETHTRNIMRKLECGSRDSIIDFIEKSGSLSLLRKHYFDLLIESTFEQKLQKISRLITIKQFMNFLLVYEEQDEAFTKKIEKHFKLASIKTSLVKWDRCHLFQDSNVPDQIFFVLSPTNLKLFLEKEENRSLFKTNQLDKATLFLFKEESEIELGKISNYVTQVNFLDNYYFCFFELLQKVYPTINLNQVISEFKETYETTVLENKSSSLKRKEFLTLDQNADDNTVQEHKISSSRTLNLLKKREWQLFLVICFIIIIREVTISGHNTTPLINYFQSCSPKTMLFFTIATCFIAIIVLHKKFQAEGLYFYNAIAMIVANLHISENLHISQANFSTILAVSTFFINTMLVEFHGNKSAQKSIFLTISAQILIIVFIILALGQYPINSHHTLSQDHLQLTHFLSIKMFTASSISFVLTQHLCISIFRSLPVYRGWLSLWLRTGSCLLMSGIIDDFIFSYLKLSFLSKEFIGLWSIVTKHVLESYYNHIIFMLSSLVVCVFFSLTYKPYSLKDKNLESK